MTLHALPTDVVVYLCKFLPFKHQFRGNFPSGRPHPSLQFALAASDIGEVVWQSRRVLKFLREEAEPEPLRSVANVRGLIANLEQLILYQLCEFSKLLPLAVRLVSSSKLTSVEVNVAGNGVDLFSILALSQAPLQTLWIESTNNNCNGLSQQLSLRHLGPTLTTLGLTVSACDTDEILPQHLLKIFAEQLPNLQVLSLNADFDDIPRLKSLKKLTHLYVQMYDKASARDIFNVSSEKAANESVRRLIASTPPLVGAHVVITAVKLWTLTVLEYALRNRAGPEILAAIVTNGHYQLTFMHHDKLFPSRPGSLVNQCLETPEILEYLISTLGMPLSWQIQTPALSYSTSLFAEGLLAEDAMSLLEWLFDRPWKRALEQGLAPSELLLGTLMDGKQVSVIFETRLAETEFVLSRPDIFTNLTTMCDRMHRTLLFFNPDDSGWAEKLLAAGFDWRHVDATGRNALEWHVDKHNKEVVDIVLLQLTEEEVRAVCTAAIWAETTETFKDSIRSKASNHPDQWRAFFSNTIQEAMPQPR